MTFLVFVYEKERGKYCFDFFSRTAPYEIFRKCEQALKSLFSFVFRAVFFASLFLFYSVPPRNQLSKIGTFVTIQSEFRSEFPEKTFVRSENRRMSTNLRVHNPAEITAAQD